MIDLQDSAEPAHSFAFPERSPGPLDAATASALASSAGELVLVLDPEGIILDVSAGKRDHMRVRDWIGRKWIDTVTAESRGKVEEMLAPGSARGQIWRQVNHLLADHSLPIRYRLLPLGMGGYLAIGRDMRAAATMQQRLLQVQQSLERDHMRLRQAESRYRMLFDRSAEPMIVAEAASGRVREINQAAVALTGERAASRPISSFFAGEDRDRVIAFLGAVSAGAPIAPMRVRLSHDDREVALSANAFRRDGGSFHLIRLNDIAEQVAHADANRALAGLVERMPDAFIIADADLAIVGANAAFIELAHAASFEQIRGKPLDQFLGRRGIDLDLILGQLREHSSVRNVSTILFGTDGGQEEVEVSAVRTDSAGEEFGFCIRAVGRRLRDLPPAERDLPRSVEQLTDLVGRMPLKNIVRESTDLIERLCIEAALAYTSDNRASAAEILGLSRQSLYSKLHRHGLGNLAADAAE